MIIAAAQTQPFEGDLQSNLKQHLELADRAADQGAALLLFPEMSLTGYTREHAEAWALTLDDPRLVPLRQKADQRKIVLIPGAPVRMLNKLYISALVYQPSMQPSLYTKHYLHEGEENYFHSGFAFDPVIRLGKDQASLAICYDIENVTHPEQACRKGTTLYLASIFYSMKSMTAAHETLSRHARENRMNILMANYCGTCWDTLSGGRSAFWNPAGTCLQSLDEKQSGLLLVEMA
jgi:predicted amidohydrolase